MHPISVRDNLLKGISITYLWAFASLYHQIPGLYGDEGILPVRSKLDCEDSPVNCAFFGDKPTVLYLLRQIPLSPMGCMELATLIGMLLSGLSFTFSTMRNPMSYLILWYMYLSLVQVGGDFLHFQWDSLLLEAGFLTILLAPFDFLRWPKKKWLPQDNVAIFLIRWLAFRLMFASGVVKLLGQHFTWWNLSALEYHFSSQCIPTPFAWYAHQLPAILKEFSVMATFIILIFLSIFMMTPSKPLRYIAFAGQTLLMVMIALTGNYNFFNFLSVVLCSAALVDTSFSSVGTHTWKRKFGTLYTPLKFIVAVTGVIILFALCYVWFAVDMSKEKSNISLKLEMKNFQLNLARYYPYVILMGILSYISELVAAIIRFAKDLKKEKGFKRIIYGFQMAIVCFAATAMFGISLVPMTFIDNVTWGKLPENLKSVYEKTSKYHLAHSYGLFSSMTGVGGRPEISVEGFDQKTEEWIEYEFMYKPGDVTRRLPIVVPHQPRLDWQMWFVALDTFDKSPWFLSLTYRLLSNSKPVIDLLKRSPFDQPPSHIRGILYHYNYTNWNDHSKAWWTREEQGEFMGSFKVDNESLLKFLKQSGLIVQTTTEKEHHAFAAAMAKLRTISSYFTGVQFVHAVTFTLLAPKIIGNKLSN